MSQNDPKPVYEFHVFCCTTRRPDDSPHPSCGQKNSQDLTAYLREKVAELELENVRINPASCLGRCDQGPAMVIYPEGTWYKFTSREDLDEILNSHLMGKGLAERLLMPAP